MSHSITGTLIVLNKNQASASLLDLADGRECARLPTGVGPHEVAVSPDGRTAVICDYGDRAAGNSLTIVDLPAIEIVRTIDLGDYHRPHGIVFDPDGRRVIVTCEDNQALITVDIESGTVVQATETGAKISHMVAVTPDHARAFVANLGSGSITAIDLVTGAKIAEVPTGEGSEGVDVSPDGREVWVSNRAAENLTILDAGSLATLDTVPCASFPIRVKFTTDGRRVLISNARTGDVAVFEAATRVEIARIEMKATAVEKTDDRLFGDRFGDSPVPVGILVHPDGRHAFVANTNADLVTVLDLDDLAIAGRLVAGSEPDGLGWTGVEIKADS